jgi:hypothetical protein
MKYKGFYFYFYEIAEGILIKYFEGNHSVSPLAKPK